MKTMRKTTLFLTLSLAAVLVACAGEGAEEAPEADTTAQTGEEVRSVPDSTITREIQTRLDADPRLDEEGVEIEVHVTEGDVTLVGEVPTRFEQSVAREVASSAPGVREVYLDSLVVAAEAEQGEGADAEAETQA
ncbi:MAG: BON domain-containing protein [Gemmatimonadota bacterium]|nr:BON domain-containing protein [Gemmatimonadota bacterium]